MTVFRVKALTGAIAIALSSSAALAQDPAQDQDQSQGAERAEPAAERESGTGQDGQSEQSGQTDPIDRPAGGVRPDPQAGTEAGENERRPNYYLGPHPRRGAPPGEQLPERPADEDPKALLPGPFVPQESIEFPSLADRPGDETGHATDEAAGEPMPAGTQDRPGTGAGAPDVSPDASLDVSGESESDRQTDLLTEPLAAPGQRPVDAAAERASGTDTAPAGPDFAVITDTLASLDPAGIGLADVPGGALPVSFWNGTPRARLPAILSTLTLPVASARQTRLALQLLLSPADLSAPVNRDPAAPDAAINPDGRTGAETSAGTERTATDSPANTATQAEGNVAEPVSARVLEARLGLLHAGGHSQALLALYDVLPQNHRTPPMRRLAADALLAMGRYRDVCRLAGDAVMDDDSPYWLRVRALCEAIGDNRSAAYFQIDLLEESQAVGASFLDLIERVLADTEEPAILPLGDIDRLDPVTFAATQLTRVSFPADLAATAPAILMQPVATSDTLPADVRLPAARQAARLALIDGVVLRNLFADLDFSDAERATAMTMAESDSSFRTDALLYRMAAEETDPVARARWIMAAFDRARRAGTARIVSEVLAGPAGAITPDPQLAFFADTAGRIHLLAEQRDKAEAWYEMVRGLASGANADATKALVDLWPLMVILDSEDRLPYSERILDLWWQSRAVLPADERKRRAALFYGLLEAFEYAVPAAKWEAVLTAPAFDGVSPPLSQWRQMIRAGRARRLGETATLALAALGTDGPGAANPSALSAAVYHLDQVGLGATARRLAVEALIARGF